MSTLSLSEPASLVIVFFGLLFGAILKGATGAGLPIIAIPTIAAFYDIRVAVALLVIPNFVTNAWQIGKYRAHNSKQGFAVKFAISGIAGAGIGTLLLAYLPLAMLNFIIAIVVFTYIGLRLFNPEFQLSMAIMQKWVLFAGSCAGVLQGAVGLSSPITITFLHAARLPRPTFIYIVSLFFAGMSVIQLPLQSVLGLMTLELAILSVLALVPIFIGLPIGDRIGKSLSTHVFDRLILILLTVLAIKMLADVTLLVQSG